MHSACLSPGLTNPARAARGPVAGDAVGRPAVGFATDEPPDAHPVVGHGCQPRSHRSWRCVPAPQPRAVTGWRCRTRRRAVAHAGLNAGSFEPLDLAAIAARSARTGGPICAEVQINAQGQAPGFSTHICDVAVDPETGFVKILRYTAIQDVGRAIHPSYVEGQMQGGVAQGIGWALNEEYVYDRDGRLENPGFLDYRVPVCSDLPMIDAILIEVPNPRHPFGARGVGEVPIVPPMAAVANAIADATGLRLRDLPMSPSKLRAAIDEQDPPRIAAE